MNKLSIKKLIKILLIQSVGCFVLSLVSSIFLLKPALTTKSETAELVNQYSEVKYDYKIIQPSEEQITNFTNDDSTKAVFKYYSLNYISSYNGGEFQMSVIGLGDNSNVEYTEFNSDRIFDSLDNYKTEGIYLDYEFAKNNSLELGETISIGLINLKITALLKKCNPAQCFSPELLSFQETVGEMKYYGVYVVCNDKGIFADKFLENYIPYGQMRDQSSFKTEEQYQEYVETFMSKDYSSLVIDKDANRLENQEKFDNSQKNIKKNFVLSYIVVAIVSLLLPIGLFLLDRKTIYEENRTGIIKQSKNRFIISSVISFIIFATATLIAALIIINNLMSPLLYSAVIKNLLFIILFNGLALFAGSGINLLLIRKIEKRK